ncbi:MAG: hypothetical protein ACD_39C01868G0003 [uncultured bacterium]|nr:MAG: hypothetical protein ACD_39C01868G0003 [uncultured bacterium]
MSPVKQSPIEKIADWSCSSSGFYADDPAYRARIPEQLRQSELFPLLTSRALLREFCTRNQFVQPPFISESQFDKLAAWAVKRNQFPLAMKSAVNGSDSDNCYILKAFRELPEFYEAIVSSIPGPVILEEFISAKSRIEVTFIAGLPRLIAQYSLEKSMRMRQIWRVFPIRPPESLVDQICAIAGKFPGLSSIKEVPVRFSFALSNKRLILLSLNAGLNRPEYHPDWSHAAGITSIFEAARAIGNRTICKLLIYYGSNNFSESDLHAVGGSNLVRLSSTEEQTMVLLRSNESARLLEDAEKVDTFFKHCRSSDYEPPLPPEE